LTKRDAIAQVNDYLGHKLLKHTNTRFASVNSAKPVWWLDIPAEMFDKELHVLLAGSPVSRGRGGRQGLIWLKLKARTVRDPGSRFYVRPDNGKIQLNISCSPTSEYLRDTTGTGYDFRRHVEKQW
jgi:hypothetical protein